MEHALYLPHFVVSRQTTRQGYTALLVACQAGKEDLANFLVAEGAALGATTARGMSALHLAAETGAAGMIRMLCDAGVSVCVCLCLVFHIIPFFLRSDIQHT